MATAPTTPQQPRPVTAQRRTPPQATVATPPPSREANARHPTPRPLQTNQAAAQIGVGESHQPSRLGHTYTNEPSPTGGCCPRRVGQRCGRARRAHPECRLQALHRVVHPGRDPEADRAICRRGERDAQPGTGQHGHRAERAHDRQHRRLPRIHGHDRQGNPEARRGSVARRTQREAGAHGPRGRRSAGLQQYLCAGDARRRCARQEHRAAVRLEGASRRAAWAFAGIHRTRRRLARIEAHLRAAVRHAARPRSRARVRSHRATPGRRDRHLLDRRQARQVRLDGARGRPQVLPALRRGASVSRGSSAALAARRGPRSPSSKGPSTMRRCAG